MHENSIKQSEDLLNEASTALQRARNLVSSYDYSGTVEAAQHSIEHAVKSMYRLVNLEHPKKHDASIELEKVTRRLDFLEPYSYLKESLGRIRLISTMWSWAHSTSIYGCLDIPASKIFKEKDAKTAIEYASEVWTICNNFIYFKKIGIVKIQIT